jgi:hypothetical protein
MIGLSFGVGRERVKVRVRDVLRIRRRGFVGVRIRMGSSSQAPAAASDRFLKKGIECR